MVKCGKLGNGGGKRRQQGMIEMLESRQLLSDTWVTLSGPTGGSGPSGAPVEGNTVTYTVNYFWDSAFSPGGTVNISYGGSAEAGDDYCSLVTSVAIPSNPNPYPSGGSVPFTVLLKSDNVIEAAPKSLVVAISSTSPGLRLRPYGFPDNLDPTPYIQSTANILDDPPVVSLLVVDGSATENADGEPADPGEILLTRSGGDINQPLSVGLTGTGTATFADDYGLPDLVTFEPGQDAMTVPVTIIDDTEAEGIETAVISILPNPSTYLIAGAGSGTVNIDDNVSVQQIIVVRTSDKQYFYGYDLHYSYIVVGEHPERVNLSESSALLVRGMLYNSQPFADPPVFWTGTILPLKAGEVLGVATFDDGYFHDAVKIDTVHVDGATVRVSCEAYMTTLVSVSAIGPTGRVLATTSWGVWWTNNNCLWCYSVDNDVISAATEELGWGGAFTRSFGIAGM